MTFAPLKGVTVVELTENASAPYAGEILAHLGATVWKIERPQGDASRSWGPSIWKGCGASFHALNRGKATISLDIKNADDLASLKQMLTQRADIFLHNLRPGASPRYGLDYESVRALNEGIVYCDVGAFGSGGDLSTAPGYDPLMQAFSGIMSITGEADGAPVRSGVSIIDIGSGMWAAIGMLSAWVNKLTTGQGCEVSVSLLDTAMAWMSIPLAHHATDGVVMKRLGSSIGFIAPSKAFSTKDGYLMISCANDGTFIKLCGVLGLPELPRDPRFITNDDRVKHRQVLDELIESILLTRTREDWLQVMSAADVPASPVMEIPEVYRHPHIRATGIFSKPSEDEIDLVGLPIKFDKQRVAPLAGAGAIGRNNSDFVDALAATRES